MSLPRHVSNKLVCIACQHPVNFQRKNHPYLMHIFSDISKVAATRKKAEIMKMGVDSLTNKAAKMIQNRQTLKQELTRAKICIDQDDFDFDVSR